MDGNAFGGADPKTVELSKIPLRPWWCAECKAPALLEGWKAFGVCDPCENRLRNEREWQARKSKAGDR